MGFTMLPYNQKKIPPVELIYLVEILDPEVFHHSFEPSDKLFEMSAWCRKNVGSMKIKWDISISGTDDFMFENEIDAMAFKLRWL